jgi:hypothetical protein
MKICQSGKCPRIDMECSRAGNKIPRSFLLELSLLAVLVVGLVADGREEEGSQVSERTREIYRSPPKSDV